MLNFGASKPRVGGGARAPGPPLDPHLDQKPERKTGGGGHNGNDRNSNTNGSWDKISLRKYVIGNVMTVAHCT